MPSDWGGHCTLLLAHHLFLFLLGISVPKSASSLIEHNIGETVNQGDMTAPGE